MKQFQLTILYKASFSEKENFLRLLAGYLPQVIDVG